MIEVKITSNESGRKLHSFLRKNLTNQPISMVYKLIADRNVWVNGKRTKNKNLILTTGDVVGVFGVENFSKKEVPVATTWSFKVVFEDKNILIVNKPTGLKMHDDADSLDAEVRKYFINGGQRKIEFSSINRLDKLASGIVIYGKNYLAIRTLKDNVKAITKIYKLKSDFPTDFEERCHISHSEKLRKMLCSKRLGKKTHTKFWVAANNARYAQIFTGYKHQIRASLEYNNFPIYGDKKYGGKTAYRLYLHLETIKFQDDLPNLAYLSGIEFYVQAKW